VQVGINQFFDLVYYDKLDASRTFRVRKLTQFEDFKQQVSVVYRQWWVDSDPDSRAASTTGEGQGAGGRGQGQGAVWCLFA
jgi:hypothetical protein